MSNSCCQNKSLLSRDGTSQQQRVLKALLPGYVAVDERNIEDLKSFVSNFAKELWFFSENNQEDGNWEDFFTNKSLDTTYKTTDPHYALFYAFLKLFKFAQDDINKITKKHIDFFYRDVLQLKERDAVADQVFIIFELAKHVSSLMIKKGTKLKAGKDALGNELTYTTDKDIVVNKSQVKELKSLYISEDASKKILNAKNLSVYASPVSNSSDGEGAEIDTDDNSWKTFGDVDIENPDRDLADLGFAFATPNLYLSEGDRIVTLKLKVENPKIINSLNTIQDVERAFRVKFSGEKEWIESIFEDCYKNESTLCEPIEQKILDFLNQAKNPEDIAGIEPQTGPVLDSPFTGYGKDAKRKDYDIGITVAKEIIETRDELDPPEFTSLDQVMDVKGFGKDKRNDLIYTFRQKYHFTQFDYKNKWIIIRRTLDRTQKAVVAYNKEVLTDPFDTKFPVVKVLLNKNNQYYGEIYSLLSKIKISKCLIHVNVEKISSLILQNDNAVLDPNKPFHPFTSQPQKGSSFYLGNWEAFQKKPDFVKLKFNWQNLPTDTKGFEDYYAKYYASGNTIKRSNKAFTVKVSYLEDKKWKTIKSNANLFTDSSGQAIDDATSLPGNDDLVTLNLVSEDQEIDIERSIETENFDKLDHSLLRGFMKLQLNGEDFGHKDYQLLYTKAILDGVSVSGEGDVSLDDTNIPNEPYIPTISNISLDYSSTVELSCNSLPQKTGNTVSDQYFIVHPFGVEEITNSIKPTYLLPSYTDQGYLFIGIEDLNPPQSLALLFKMAEGSAKSVYNMPEIRFSYLYNNEWTDFSTTQLLGDTTDSFMVSGIINLSIPKAVSNDNTILTDGLHWVRVACSSNLDAVPDMIAVKTQAVTASFDDNNNDPDHLALALSGDTIKKLKTSDSSVKSLSQPYESFGGRTQEESESFYKRISERLRHKNRAITIWDYERLILEEFNTVYKVKCLNHTNISLDPINTISPGDTSIIVVPDVKNRTDIDLLEPKANQGTLLEISDFIEEIKSPSTTVYVDNPLYERIKMSFCVYFLTDDVGYYLTQLNEDLKKFLAPWAYNSDSEVVFGGKIHKSVILNYVEELEYVDYVQSFKMYQSGPIKEEPAIYGPDIDEATASTPASILTSASNHDIFHIDDASCSADDNVSDTRKYGEIKNCIEG
jgi:hypothetical protein